MGTASIGVCSPAASPKDVRSRVWRERVPAEKLLAEARKAPPPPPDEPLSWDWCAGPDPLLGPWVEPSSLPDALARLEELQAAMRGRRLVLAKAWSFLRWSGAWAFAGYESAEALANDVFGVSLRTAQRMYRVGWALEWYSELERAVRDGLPFGVADQLSRVIGGQNATGWLEVAARVGRIELCRAVDAARAGSERRELQRYRRAIRAADAFARSRPETTAAAPLRVALPQPESEASPAPLRAPPELPIAARWLVETVQIPPKRGFAAVKDRDDHRCANPECRRRSLRNEAHHRVWRQHGGGDDPENAMTVCRPDHVRLIHTGRVTVERVRAGGVDALLWGYPGGRYVLSFLDEPGWFSERAGAVQVSHLALRARPRPRLRRPPPGRRCVGLTQPARPHGGRP